MTEICFLSKGELNEKKNFTVRQKCIDIFAYSNNKNI